MIYLNGGFEGGATNFLRENAQLPVIDGKYVPLSLLSEDHILEQVFPEAGLALIFLHNHLH
jgi:tryptophan synthase alpha subunit